MRKRGEKEKKKQKKKERETHPIGVVHPVWSICFVV